MDVGCGDSAAFAGYLYDEISLEERAAVERHLAICTGCAEEIAALQDTRQMLASWAPPDTLLGFRVVAEDAPVDKRTAHATPADTPRWWQLSMPVFPAWAQAAAALVLFAGGALVAAMMNVEVRYDQAGLTIRTGREPQPVAATIATVSKDDLEALEARLRRELAQVRAAEPGGARMAMSTDDVLGRMREMIAASEVRQQRELALRVAQVVRDVDSTRRADIARIERTVSPLEGVTSEELLQQRQMLNYLMRVSQQK